MIDILHNLYNEIYKRISNIIVINNREKKHIPILFGILFFAFQANANDFNKLEKDSTSIKELNEIIITANKSVKELNQTNKSITIITKKEIEHAPIKSVDDLLKYVSGLDIIQRGQDGIQSDVSIRGGSFDQTAVLINGVNITSPQTGHYSLDIPIDLSDIDRIEIIKGPASMIYGSKSLVGGINIITKNNKEKSIFTQIEGGSYGSLNTSTRLSTYSKISTHSISLGYKKSNGYINNSDYNVFNIYTNNHFTIDNNSFADLQIGYNNKSYGANTFYSAKYPNQFEETKNLFFSAKGETGDKLKLMPTIYWARHYDTFHLIREGTPNIPSWYKGPNMHQSDVYGLNINMQYNSIFGITNFGGEIRTEKILSTVLGKDIINPKDKYSKYDSRTNASLLLEHSLTINNLNISAGCMMNLNSSITNKQKFYPTFSASYSFTKEIQAYTTWSNSIRIPTFTDLYYKTPTHEGNRNLQPEYSKSFEIGFKYMSNFLTSNFCVFTTKGKNLIDWQRLDDIFKSLNIAKVNNLGFDINLIIKANEIIGNNQPIKDINIGYQHINQNSKDANNLNPISNYVLNYLRDKLTITINMEIIKNISLYCNFRWQDRNGSYLKIENNEEKGIEKYKNFCTLDLKIEYNLKNINLYANINNILNKKYFDLGNIPQPQRWITLGLNYMLK